MAKIKELTIKDWEKLFDWSYCIWTSQDYKQYLSDSVRKYKTWSSIEIDGQKYLIPGVNINSDMLYFTKNVIDYNVIVKL